MDHDQRFKTLIREFFDDFLLLFFADWAAHLDLSGVEWLDKELYPDPPEGSRHVLDLVARVPIAATTDPVVNPPESCRVARQFTDAPTSHRFHGAPAAQIARLSTRLPGCPCVFFAFQGDLPCH